MAVTLALALHGAAHAAAPVQQALLDHATQARPDVVKLLERLVNIDSGTGSEKGLDKVGAIVADEAKNSICAWNSHRPHRPPEKTWSPRCKAQVPPRYC